MSWSRLPLVLALLFVAMTWCSTASWAGEDNQGLPIMEESGIGSVSLHNTTLDKVDTACLTGLVKKLVADVDDHQVAYLKMLIFADDSMVTDLTSGPHLVIGRGAVPAFDLIISLEKGAPNFLSKTSPEVYSAGVMPENLDFSKCLK